MLSNSTLISNNFLTSMITIFNKSIKSSSASASADYFIKVPVHFANYSKLSAQASTFAYNFAISAYFALI